MNFTGQRRKFDDENMNPFESIAVQSPALSLAKTGFWQALRLPLLIGMAAGLTALSIWVFTHSEAEKIEAPFVYVEIKALTDQGHPIAGAQIKFGDLASGLTDAFGEWRRYLKAEPGTKVGVKLLKESPQGRLVGGKTIVMPKTRNEKGEISVKSRIQLSPFGGADHSQTVAPKPLKAQAHENPSISVVLEASSGADEHSQHFYQRLNDQVLPRLKSLLAGYKTVATSPADFRLVLAHIPQKGRPGFIKGQISWLQSGEWQTASFLRNFAETPEQTGKDILSVAKAYIPFPYSAYQDGGHWFVKPPEAPKGFFSLTSEEILTDGLHFYPLSWDLKTKRLELLSGEDKPCGNSPKACQVFLSTLVDRPPQAGWEKLRVKITGAIPPNSLVFVAGLEARVLKEQTYEFWGKPKERMNLTILRGDKVFYRENFETSRPNPALVMLHGASLAKR